MRSVIHVLPHPGGGGETYVNTLSEMDGYRFERRFLAPSAQGADALRSLPRSGIGVQLDARKHDVVHVHGEVAGAICLPSLALRPSVVTLHGLHLLRRLTGIRAVAATAQLRLVVRAATRTICVAQAEYDEVLDAVGARAGARVRMIHNGIEPLPVPTAGDRAAAREELGIPAGTTVGVSVGSLDERKDPLAAVRAAIAATADSAPLALLIAGDGPLRADLEQLARTSGGAVRVLGFRRDVERILAAADFFVISSHREGLSYSLLEAMSIGLPAIVSDAPGNPEAVGDAGIVVARGDVAGFAAAFRQLLSEPDRLDLGERARERVAHQFRADEMIRRTRELYDEARAGSP